MAGEYAQLKETAEYFPYWQYWSMEDRRVRESHAAMHGKVFMHNDPIWDIWFPPNGFNCRCGIKALNGLNLKKRGLKVEKGSAYANLKPDKGFEGNPGKALDYWIEKGKNPLEKESETVNIKTVKDYEKEIEEKYSCTVKLNKLPGDISEAVRNILIELKEMFPQIKFNSIKALSLKKSSGTPALHKTSIYNNGKIKHDLIINTAYTSKFKNLKELNADIQKSFNEKWWTSQTIEDIVIHEIGHNLTYRKAELINEDILVLDKELREKRYLLNVSEYSKVNFIEMLAEGLVFYYRKMDLPGEVLEYLKKYLGVK